MKTLSIQLVAVLAALAIQLQAEAQGIPGGVGRVQQLHNVQSQSTMGLRPHYYPSAPFAAFHHHSSTAAEGYLRGMAARVYAQGLYNRLNAEARVIHAEAARREVENREMAAETYFAMRAANREARAAERGPRPTAAYLARLAEQAKPDRLSPGEINTTTGEVSWPLLLQGDEYAQLRADLEDVFITRAAVGEVGLEEQAKVALAAKAMLSQLKQVVRDVRPMDYTAAQQFIRSLAQEVKLPTS